MRTLRRNKHGGGLETGRAKEWMDHVCTFVDTQNSCTASAASARFHKARLIREVSVLLPRD